MFSRCVPSGIAKLFSHMTFSVANNNAQKSHLVDHDQYYLSVIASFELWQGGLICDEASIQKIN